MTFLNYKLLTTVLKTQFRLTFVRKSNKFIFTPLILNKIDMKKIIFAAVAVFGFAFANAQEVKFGAKAALNIATLTGDVEDANSKIGVAVGGFVEIKVSDKFSVQPELLYSTQGAKSEYSEDFGGGIVVNTEETWRLSYLNLPIMAKYYVADKFSLEAGPQVGFLLGSEQEAESSVTFGGQTESETVTVDAKDFTSSIDFGFNIGAGYDFTENLSAGLRYNIGLSNIIDVEGSNSDVKNSVFSVSLGYKF